MSNSHDHSCSKPKIIGYYSVDGDRNYLPDSSRMFYYNPPQPGSVWMDLNQGIESAVLSKASFDTSERLNHLLKWIELNSAEFRANEISERPEFVCSHGILENIMCTPHITDHWTIQAAKWRGKIYFFRLRTGDDPYFTPDLSRKCTSWIHKFQQYVVSDRPDVKPNTSRPVIETAEFRCILKRRFGAHSVLFSATMDAVCSKTVLEDPLPLDKLKFVSIKTKNMMRWEGQEIRFRRLDLPRWWSQSFASGVESILCGFRDTEGIVRYVSNYSLDQIVEMCKYDWSPQAFVKYCDEFLSFVSKTVVEECDTMIYKFEKISPDRIITTQKPPTSSNAFIPSSFLEKMR